MTTLTTMVRPEAGAATSTKAPARPSRRAEPAQEPILAAGEAEATLAGAVEALFRKLRPTPEGRAAAAGLHWCAELEGDSILSSEYLLMKWILGQEGDGGNAQCTVHNAECGARGECGGMGREGGVGRFGLICSHLRLVQRAGEGEDGTWGQYPGSPPDLSACVKAYFALKLFGEDPDAPHMARARESILALGGAEKINTFSMFYLACLGQVSWDACPAIPPEIVLLPRWFPFHMDKVAAWTRTMILPLAICSALRPVREVPRELGIEELFVDPAWWAGREGGGRGRLNQEWRRDEPAGWTNFFLACDRFLKAVQRHGLSPLRPRALKEAERWLLSRMTPETTEGLGAIFPPMVYIQVALQALGYERSHPVIVEAERQLDAFILEEKAAKQQSSKAANEGGAGLVREHVRLQPCFSPVWDTGIALYAMTEAGITAGADRRIAEVCDWLLDRQASLTGDWVRNLRPEDQDIRLGAGGDAAAWAFEYRNDWYPDVDDTAMIAKALWRAAPGAARQAEYRQAAAKARRWILAMQNEDGGWAAFDRTKDRPWMEHVPFADHNAMQDPSCSDITGRTIESLITCGLPRDHDAITRAVAYLLRTQEPGDPGKGGDGGGCWIGRWGVNYIYGTWQAMGGLWWAMGGGMHDAKCTMQNEEALRRARGFEPMRRAVVWIRSVQNADGGFGESANSYLDPTLKGRGPSTASQTAWGLMCLLYVCDPHEPCVQRAVKWLCDHQLRADKGPFQPAQTASGRAVYGTSDLSPKDWVWDYQGAFCEHVFTGTGFPKVFYLRYNMYRHYFPVMALGRYVSSVRSASQRA